MARKSKKIEPISAQVVLSAESLSDPEPVINEFTRAGFAVGPLFANSFSITAPSRKFETYFHISLQSSAKEGILVRSKEKSVASNLPLDALPTGIRKGIEAVLFTKPPDFGPAGNY